MARRNQFTIYDKMEWDGVFDANPANIQARSKNGLSIYKKQLFPKMLYHPKGEERVTAPAEAVATPFGPKWLGEQRELVSRSVESPEEYAEAKKAGWWDTPAESIAKRPVGAKPQSAEQKALEAAQAEIASLKSKLTELEA